MPNWTGDTPFPWEKIEEPPRRDYWISDSTYVPNPCREIEVEPSAAAIRQAQLELQQRMQRQLQRNNDLSAILAKHGFGTARELDEFLKETEGYRKDRQRKRRP